MNLCLAYFKGGSRHAGLQRFSRQEGFPLREIDCTCRFEYFSAIIVDEILAADELGFVLRYLQSGGAVVICGEAIRQFPGMPTYRREIKYLVAEADSIFAGAGLIDCGMGATAVPARANMLPDQRGRKSVYAGAYQGGTIVTLPFDLESATATGEGPVRTKSFYADRSRLPFEQVAEAGHGAIRKVCAAALMYVHIARKIPYVHEWYYPDGAPSFAVFRVDTDYAKAPAIQGLYLLLKQRKMQATWFVDVKSQESILGEFARMQGHEMGLHCYDHETYPDADRNKKNLSRGLSILRKAGFEGHGFAAPFGKWNANLDRVISELGFTYSSEFSYDYDNLPSFVPSNNSSNLQIPVHPISIGGLKRQGFSPDEMIAYFERTAREKYSAREPLFFYHHPNDGNLPTLERLFDLFDTWEIPRGTMQEFCDWWLLREQGQVPVQKEYHSYERNTLSMTADVPDRIRYRVVTQAGEIFVPGKGSHNLAELDWQDLPIAAPVPSDIVKIRRFNPWVPIIRFQNRIFK